MPWTADNPPDVAKNWTQEERQKCVVAANAVLSDTGDDAQAIYACIRAAGKSNQAAAHFAKGHELDMEIFRPGTWSGSAGPLPFTVEDMDKIAAAFESLSPYHRVPLKLGHSGDKDVREGQPALGWVEKVWVEGGKLMARAQAVTDTVWEALKNKLYRNVSIELDMGVEHKGTKYPLVLSGVALLGAELPAVNGLADLQSYMCLHGEKQAVFTATTEKASKPNVVEEGKMTTEELAAKVSELAEKVTALGAQTVEFQQKFAKSQQRVAELEIENQDLKNAAETRAAAEKKDTTVGHRRKVMDTLDALVKGKHILPTQREVFVKSYGVDDDERVTKIDIDSIPKMFGVDAVAMKRGGKKTADLTREYAMGSGSSTGNASEEDAHGEEKPDEAVHRKATKMAAEQKIPYRQAMDAVLAEDPELAKAWFTRRETVSVGEEG